MKKLSNNLIILIIGWFVLSYALLWFFGGSCTSMFIDPSNVSSTCLSSQSLSGVRDIPIIGLMIPFNEWVSSMYWLAPIVGFILAYLFINWWNDYFETKEAASIIFLAIILVVLFAGFFINLAWYYNEAAAGNSRDNVNVGGKIMNLKVGLQFCFVEATSAQCNEYVNRLNNDYAKQAVESNSSVVYQAIGISYWSELRESIYLTFILGAIAAWLPLFGLAMVDKYKNKKED